MVRAEVRRVIEIISAIARESVHRDRIFSKTRGEAPMRNDEARGIIVIAEVATESRAVHADLKIFPDLKMQMCVIPPVRCADCSDLLTTRHVLSARDENRVQVPVKRVDGLDHAVFTKAMADDHHVPPSEMHIARKNDHTAANAADRIVQVGIATADTIPIFA